MKIKKEDLVKKGWNFLGKSNSKDVEYWVQSGEVLFYNFKEEKSEGVYFLGITF